jgi:hypothetical protein
VPVVLKVTRRPLATAAPVDALALVALVVLVALLGLVALAIDGERWQ